MIFVYAVAVFLLLLTCTPARAQSPLTNLVLGHSGGAGSLETLRYIMDRERLWEKYGLNVKSVYFNSGGVLTQALAGGNIAGSESEVPGMLNLAVSGVLDLKLVTVTINKIEHVFIVRKNIGKPEELKGKKLAVSRFGSASDTVTRLVLKLWKIDIDPPIVFGLVVKKSTILYYVGINRIFKRIRITRLIKQSILLFGKINFIISSFFVYCVIGITG